MPNNRTDEESGRMEGPGKLLLAGGWSVRLPLAMHARYDSRFDDNVLEVPGLTFRYWTAPLDRDHPPEHLLQELARLAKGHEVRRSRTKWGLRIQFETAEKRRVGFGKWRTIYCFYGYAITLDQYCHFQGYADRRKDVEAPRRAFQTLKPVPRTA